MVQRLWRRNVILILNNFAKIITKNSIKTYSTLCCLVKSPHIKAEHHLPLLPGTNVPVINALAHTIVKENLVDEAYVKERCDMESFDAWKQCVLKPENDPDNVASIAGVDAQSIKDAARLYGSAKRGAIY